jgi:protein tyrosine/serine phosphatase
VLLAIAVVAAVAGYIWYSGVRTYHFAAVEEGVLYRDGVRSVDELANAVNRAQIATVVSLVDDTEIGQEPFNSELKYCFNSHIRILRVPITRGGWPTNDAIKSFLDTATNPKNKPLLVHCAQGVRRTGMMVAAYQMSVLKWDKDKTKAAILSYGHSDKTIGDIQRFIDNYDPVKHQLTQTLPPSNE